METANQPCIDQFNGCIPDMEDECNIDEGRRRCTNLGLDDMLDEKPLGDDLDMMSELSTADGWSGRNTRTSLCERESGSSRPSRRDSGRYSAGRDTAGRYTAERASFKRITGASSSSGFTSLRSTEDILSRDFNDVLPSDAVVAGVASLLKLAHSNRAQPSACDTDELSLLSEMPPTYAQRPQLPDSSATRTAPPRVMNYRMRSLFRSIGNANAKTMDLPQSQTTEPLDTTESTEAPDYFSEVSTTASDAGSDDSCLTHTRTITLDSVLMSSPYASEGTHLYASEGSDLPVR